MTLWPLQGRRPTGLAACGHLLPPLRPPTVRFWSLEDQSDKRNDKNDCIYWGAPYGLKSNIFLYALQVPSPGRPLGWPAGMSTKTNFGFLVTSSNIFITRIISTVILWPYGGSQTLCTHRHWKLIGIQVSELFILRTKSWAYGQGQGWP
jgi:hypothetical protein